MLVIAHACRRDDAPMLPPTGDYSGSWCAYADTSIGLPQCSGLLGEAHIQWAGLARGYAVVVAFGSASRFCWNVKRSDVDHVRDAIYHVRNKEQLPDDMPIIAANLAPADSLVSRLAVSISAGGLPGLRCVVMPAFGSPAKLLENRGIPTLLVHTHKSHAHKSKAGKSSAQKGQGQPGRRMHGSAVHHKGMQHLLREKGVRVSELDFVRAQVSPKLFHTCVGEKWAAPVFKLLQSSGLLDSSGYLLHDPQAHGSWRAKMQLLLLTGRQNDTFKNDTVAASNCVLESMKALMPAKHAHKMLDFCEMSAESAAEYTALRRGYSKEAEPAAKRSSKAATSERTPAGQVLVFDAGSSGTRVHIFNVRSFSRGKHVPEMDLAVRDVQTMKIKPGLSQFARHGDEQGAAEKIRTLLAFARKLVPRVRRSATPILFKATAGLRAVKREQADAVMSRIRKELAESGFAFREGWAGIIEGKEEAGLAWVAANYLGGSFGKGRRTQSVGIIEMGGGSTQVAFEVTKSEPLDHNDEFVFVTGQGRRYRVYAHSYLGYGQDYAQAKLREIMPKHDSQDPCYPVGYRRPTGIASNSFVQGSGNSEACKANISKSLFSKASDTPGFYHGERPLHGKLWALQNFFFARKDAGLPLKGDHKSMDAAAKQVCSTAMEVTAEQAQAMEAGKADAGHPNSCFGLCFQSVLMSALQAPSIPSVHVQIANQINGSDADWALGAAVIHILERHQERETDSHFAFFVPTLSLVLMAVLALVVVRGLCLPQLRRMLQAQPKRQYGPKATKIGAKDAVPA